MAEENSKEIEIKKAAKVAEKAEITGQQCANLRRAIHGIQHQLEVTRTAMDVYLLSVHVQGDKKVHRKLRAWPVDRSLAGALRHLKAANKALENVAHERHEFDTKVADTKKARDEKRRAKLQKKNPGLRTVEKSGPEPFAESGSGVTGERDVGYSETGSAPFWLNKKESA